MQKVFKTEEATVHQKGVSVKSALAASWKLSAEPGMLLPMGEATQPAPRSHPSTPGRGRGRREPSMASPVFPAPFPVSFCSVHGNITYKRQAPQMFLSLGFERCHIYAPNFINKFHLLRVALLIELLFTGWKGCKATLNS